MQYRTMKCCTKGGGGVGGLLYIPVEESQGPLQVPNVGPLRGDGLVDALLPHSFLLADSRFDGLDTRLVDPERRLDVVELLGIGARLLRMCR
jgi:hypothetical protein